MQSLSMGFSESHKIAEQQGAPCSPFLNCLRQSCSIPLNFKWTSSPFKLLLSTLPLNCHKLFQSFKEVHEGKPVVHFSSWTTNRKTFFKNLLCGLAHVHPYSAYVSPLEGNFIQKVCNQTSWHQSTLLKKIACISSFGFLENFHIHIKISDK